MKTEGKRINIIDSVFVIFLAIIVIFAIVGVSGKLSKKQEANSDKVRYSIEFLNVEDEFLDYVEEGDIAYEGKTKGEIGKIVSVYESPARQLVQNDIKQVIEYVNVPDKKNVTVEIEADATKENGDIFTNSFEIKIGKTMGYIVGDAASNGTIISIEFIDGNSVKGGADK